MARQIVWTSKMVEEAAEKINNGFLLSRAENPFHEGTIGLRKNKVTFKMTPQELQEYIKCKTDVHYFAENYCWIKGEKGEPVKLVLRDYQKDILDKFYNHRFNILMASRQIGKCIEYNSSLLIYDKKLEVYKKVKIFNLLYMINENKTIIDHTKYLIYSLIDILNN
jgi:hypothetical protein